MLKKKELVFEPGRRQDSAGFPLDMNSRERNTFHRYMDVPQYRAGSCSSPSCTTYSVIFFSRAPLALRYMLVILCFQPGVCCSMYPSAGQGTRLAFRADKYSVARERHAPYLTSPAVGQPCATARTWSPSSAAIRDPSSLPWYLTRVGVFIFLGHPLRPQLGPNLPEPIFPGSV